MTISFGTDGWRAVMSDTFTFKIGRASCREKSVDLGGSRIMQKKKNKTSYITRQLF